MRVEPLVGHSVRTDHATQATMNGATEKVIIRQADHGRRTAEKRCILDRV
jgi:hypothetical protein